MLTLALETSTRVGSVALGRVTPGAVASLGEESLEVSATHSETVLPAIDRLLRSADLAASDVEAVAIGAGPGSFTGVRIGAALARGLCFPGRATLYAYSSLAAIAAADGKGNLCGLIDARRGRVYAAGYGVAADSFVERFPPRAVALDALLDELDPDDWTFGGVLADAQRESIEGVGGRLLSRESGRPSGAGLLELVRRLPEDGRVDRPADWEPQYVRRSSAERRTGGRS